MEGNIYARIFIVNVRMKGSEYVSWHIGKGFKMNKQSTQ